MEAGLDAIHGDVDWGMMLKGRAEDGGIGLMGGCERTWPGREINPALIGQAPRRRGQTTTTDPDRLMADRLFWYRGSTTTPASIFLTVQVEGHRVEVRGVRWR